MGGMNRICPLCGGPKYERANLCRRCVKHSGRSDRAAAIHAIIDLIGKQLIHPAIGLAAAVLVQAIADRDWEWVEENGPDFMEGLGLGDWDADAIKKQGLAYLMG